ncbi:hypothetical protein Glove_575g25 [Diversispora epigaea]|uniref:Uncharacterized protein n=1 Tax=Diversispora epigaea TaxID=1348612 RepID=A0A397GHY2_9GLOM|nr:hypothetical protein Glove_575g25 [Diversispora epigaea]
MATDEKLIFTLVKKENLRLNNNDNAIFHNKKITGCAFFIMIKQKFRSYNMKGELVSVLVDFTKGLSHQETFQGKLKNFLSYKTLKKVKEIFSKFGYDEVDINIILSFKLEFVKIDDNDEELKQYINELKCKIRFYGPASATDWYFTPEKFYRIEKGYHIKIEKDALSNDSELCQDVKKVMEVLVGLLKDRINVEDSSDYPILEDALR